MPRPARNALGSKFSPEARQPRVSCCRTLAEVMKTGPRGGWAKPRRR